MATIKSHYDEAMQQLTATGAPFEMITSNIGGIDYRLFKSAPANLADVFKLAYKHADKEFILYEGERWSFNQVMAKASAIGYQLHHESGVAKGDRVAIAMRNYPEWICAFIGIISIGGVAVTLNSWGQASELEYGLTDADTRIVFCDQQRLDLIAPRLQALGITAITARPTSTAMPANACSLDEFIAGLGAVAMPEVSLQPEDLALMMYTSGTTGKPKGALSSHRALCQALLAFESAAYASAMSNPDLIGKMMAKGFEPVQMLAVPLFHVSGCHAVFLTALQAGRKIVMLYKWDPDKALQLIATERVTIVSAAPSMVMQMLESEAFARTDTSSLSGLGGGGAATPPRAARAMTEKVDSPYPGTGWGLTESNAIGTSFTGRAFIEKPGAAGFASPIVDIKVCDDDGVQLPQGVPGNLWIKSPTLINGYWRRPAANASDFKDGWFNSGDIGYFDAEGYLFLSDRAKDIIIRGGENIYPAEIEAVLFNHPAVAEASVFGIADERLGEQVAACLRPRAGTNLDKDDIKKYCAEHLAAFKVPFYVWIHAGEFPKNATGKVLKKDLRAQLARNLGLVPD